MFFLALFFLDESPAWLAKRGRLADAERILKKMAGLNRRQEVDTTVVAPTTVEVDGKSASMWQELEEFSSSVLCENYGVWRWSILSRFWRILGVLVFGMWFCIFMSIWNGFGIS